MTALSHTHGSSEAAQFAARISGAPVVIEVRDVEKTFLIPRQRIDSLK